MKTIFTLLLAALSFVATGQPPKIHYQGVAVGSNGKPIKNSPIGLRLSVLDSLPTGTNLYTETQAASTDAAGQFSIYLGGGTASAGTFANIPWANRNDKFLKVEMDAQGGNNYQNMGTTQLVSVPYAMAAGTANILEDSLGTQFQISYDGNGNPFLKLKLKPIPNCGNAIMYSGESYPTVQIGRQCWLAKNLNVGTMMIADSFFFQKNNGVLEKYCYNNDAANCAIYGGLYQWAEAVQYQNGASNLSSPSTAIIGNLRGICPSGWHLPSDWEWNTLETILGVSGALGRTLKSINGLWSYPNNGATNSSGFSALPGGFCNIKGSFSGIEYLTHFWSASESSNTSAYSFYLENNNSYINNNGKGLGFSTRCIMDSCSTTISSAGSDQLSLTGTSATLAANAPVAGETGTWSILNGIGAALSNLTSPTSTFFKGTDSAYTLVWTITGPCGSSRDTLNISFQNLVMNVPCPGVASVTYSGESYPTVQIGTQCWMAKNMNIGSMIPSANVDQTNNQVIEKYCLFDDPTRCTTYGGLYQWAEAVNYQNGASNSASLSTPFTGNVRGICPTGWHLPSDAEWGVLSTFLGGSSVAGVALKATSVWVSPNTVVATNSSGFSALPGGYLRFGYEENIYLSEYFASYFWSASESSSTDAIFGFLAYDDSGIYRYVNYKKNGYSVRCLKDSICLPPTSIAGPDQLSLTGTTATLAANAPAAGETGTWSITVGSGATLGNANSPMATFTKGTDSSYTLVWTISGPCGSSRDTVNLLFPAPVVTFCGQAVNYAGESYPTVQIGTQCWFQKNLNVGRMVFGTFEQNNNGILDKYCYNNDSVNCSIYGGLYQWAEAVQYQNGSSNTTSPSPSFSGNVKGICPTGWHVPSIVEWGTLETFLGDSSVAGGAMKSTSGLWTSPNTGATNSSGFSALPGGYRLTDGSFYGLLNLTYFWLSSESSSTAVTRILGYYNSGIFRGNDYKINGFSVRCLKD